MSEREMSNVGNVMKWIEALESGEFQQGQNRLATSGETGVTYCCLGVAVVVAERNGVAVSPSWRDYLSWEYLNSVQRFYGTGENQPMLPQAEKWGHYSSPRMTCINANDEGKLTFLQIAALLRTEYHLEGSDEQAAV